MFNFGQHTVTLKVTDSQGSVGTDEVLVNVVDTTAPDTNITSNPSDPSGASVSFSFTGDDGSGCSGVASFECKLDGGSFAACTSPQNYTGLSGGSHTFQVRAIDGAGNADASPASYTWTVDTAEPNTTIDTSPSNPSNSSSASFTFSSNKPGGTFECQLDGGGFALCTSPQNYTGLSDGSHTFQVRAIDGFGNVDSSPASYTWTVDTTAPDTTIDTSPSNPSGATVSFAFSGTDAGTGVASFECQLDGGGFALCTSPQNYSGLADGSHTFQVRAKDGAGNVDATPASYTWTVDGSAPDTTITANPSNPTSSTSASFSFNSSEASSTFECKLDGGGFAACTSPQNYTGLADGSHTFQVRATDSIGNVDPTPASFTWLVDTTAPDTTITGNPPAVTGPNASFTFTGSDAGSGVASFECKLDGGSFAACTSPQSYSGLSAGGHTFQVRAIDAVGNVDATPASHTWTVVLNSPPTVSVARGGQCNVSGSTGTMNLSVNDLDGDALTITGTSSNTAVVPLANIVFGGSGTDRTVTITAVDKKSGFSDVTISVSDGKAPPVQIVIRVIVGTNKNDTINGTPGADMVFGGNGDDTVNAGGGNDLVCGGNGVGVVNGGAGDDTIDGSNGNDILRGEDGDDILLGGGGNDRLEGGNNNDTMTGGMGADAFIGGAGSDTALDFTLSQGDTKDGTTEVSAAFPLFRGDEAYGYLASWSLWGVDPYAGAGTPLDYFLTGRGPVIVPKQ